MKNEVVLSREDLEYFKAQIASFAAERQRYEAEIELLREQVRLLRAQLYGRKTEKLSQNGSGEQLLLFDESGGVDEQPETPEAIEVPGHVRKKPGRKALPEDLPRVEILHDISEEQKECGCGNKKVRIGEEVSEQLDIIPPTIRVLRHVRPKYACRNCEGVEDDGPTVAIAPVPVQLIPRSIASPGLLAHVITAKFVDALPFYRQEKQFTRLGVEIPRATMCGWAMKVAESCRPLLELLVGEIRSGPLINMDETTLQVLDEPGRSNTAKSYMWVFRGESDGKCALVYQYHPSREGDTAVKFLHGFKGYVQTDGYAGYDFIDHHPDMTHVGCWAHVRRKFMDVIKAASKNKKIKSKTGSADVAVTFIGKLYAIEKRAQSEGLNVEEIYQLRQEQAKPILEEFRKWLNKKTGQTPPKGLLGQAVSYTLKQWPRLIRYIEDGRLRPDNNLAENAIRPFVVGRKNWLFSGNPVGAAASAALYSLIETAKANKLEPYHYLRYLFEKLPFAETTEDYKALLPQYVDKSLLALPGNCRVEE